MNNSSDRILYAWWSDGSTTSRFSGSSGGSSTPDAQTAKPQLPASAFSWDGDRTLTIDYERITPLGLLSVRWNDATLIRRTDYADYAGSGIVHFGEEFIAAQAPGTHAVRVEFLNHTGEATVTVDGEPTLATEPGGDLVTGDTHNPNTGGYPNGFSATNNPGAGDGRGVWTALLLGSLSAAALVIFPLHEQKIQK